MADFNFQRQRDYHVMQLLVVFWDARSIMLFPRKFLESVKPKEYFKSKLQVTWVCFYPWDVLHKTYITWENTGKKQKENSTFQIKLNENVTCKKK